MDKIDVLPKKSRKQYILCFFIYAFLCVYALLILFPLLFVFLSSLKTNEEIFTSPWSLPQRWEFGKYVELITKYNMGQFFLNSIYYAVLSVVLAVFISAMAAYVLTRMKWRLKGFVFSLILFGLMVPIHSELVPLYIILSWLGIRTPRISLTGVYVAFALPITILILSGFIAGIPKEMEESAVMEGSSILKAFFTIIFPLMNPAIVTVVIFNFITVWNDFFAGLVFISLDKDKTLQLGIARFQGNFSTNYSYMLAAIVLVLLPSVVVYVTIQDRIIKGITTGALKG